ncbi:MAG: hypothetical protein NC489_32185 [Ruminococcus flavefaciens]|nr:hypothetical protein [Ruminococcus flavefaciens]
MVRIMSNYYNYREVKVMIAHKLMNMEGWEVYGYSPDRSDSMTDYWDPATWSGIAKKNGYVLCVDVYGAAEPQEIKKYNYSGFTYDRSIAEKIKKLEAMTVERGASEGEAASAKIMIERLQKKAEEATENANKYIVVGTVPGHMAHPPKMNWHIEKDGVIIAKGNGILKYASLWKYYDYIRSMDVVKAYKKDKKAYAEENTQELLLRGYYDNEEDARRNTERHIADLEKDIKLIDKFEAFINKIDTTCGGLLGEGDGVIYEKVTVTEYKKELKPVETQNGEIKEGQCFILKSNFNYGCYKGLVYRIHETERNGQKYFYAYKLNRKLTKECTGNASRNNYWFVGSGDSECLTKWIEKGSIAWCELKEVKTPYEVEKVVKKTIKTEKKNTTSTATETAQTEKTDVNTYTYEVSEDTDTRTGEKIYLVKVVEKLSREEYIAVNKYIKSLGGYYSKFKHAFLFKEDPTEKLDVTTTETKDKSIATEEKVQEATEATEEQQKESISYNITEDIHTQTGNKIWIVKPERELNKSDFTEVKRKLATLQGYYSTFKHGFIFKYDPTEVLQTG